MIHAHQAKLLAEEHSGLNKLLESCDSAVKAAAMVGKSEAHVLVAITGAKDPLLIALVKKLEDYKYKVYVPNTLPHLLPGGDRHIITVQISWS